MNDERLYAEVVEELRLRGPIPGLWAKAYSETNGNEPQAKALYLRYRVEQLAQAERNAFIEPHQKSEDLDDLYAKVTDSISRHASLLFGVIVAIVIVLFFSYKQ